MGDSEERLDLGPRSKTQWSWITEPFDEQIDNNNTENLKDNFDSDDDVSLPLPPDSPQNMEDPMCQNVNTNSPDKSQNMADEIRQNMNTDSSEQANIIPHRQRLALARAKGKKFRQVAFAIMASLPSQQVIATGTTVARRKLVEQRTHSAHKSRRGSVDAATMHHAQAQGLKVEFDEGEEYDEVQRMKQINVIKQMPVSIPLKRKLRNKLFARLPEPYDSSCEAFCYRQSLVRFRFQMRCKLSCAELSERLTIWRSAFKSIEGHFGSGVLSYFRFLKSLFLMNTIIFLAWFLFVVLPMIAFTEADYNSDLTGSENASVAVILAQQCSARYVVNTTGVWYEYLIDFLQGTGFMEKTVLFYGYYSDKELDVSILNYAYNMPFAYVTVVNFVILFSLCVMVTLSARGFRQRLFSNEDALRQYCNKVFGAWDFSLTDEKSGIIKHKSIHRDVVGTIEEEREEKRRKSRDTKAKFKIYGIRSVINILVMAILGAAGYLIYYTTIKTIELTASDNWSSYQLIIQFLVQYMTSLTITILNGLIPKIFKKMVKFEDYTPAVTVNLTLARTVFLRLASLAVLMFSLYVAVNCTPKDSCNVGTDTCTALECWETYVGQEFYKLVIMDFLVCFAVTFVWEFPRKLVVSKCSCKVAQLLGYQEFDISKNVLDLVYGETLLWLGMLFSPLIPAVTIVKNFLVFYLKMLSTIMNCVPNSKPFCASTSEQFFQILLLSAFTACVIPTQYVMWRMTPSRGCGPFRIYDTMMDIIPVTVDTWPDIINSILDFIMSAGVIVAIFVILILAVHYMGISIKAYKDMVKMMKEQIYMEGQDKQFLMARIQELVNKGSGKKNSFKKTRLSPVVDVDVEAPPLPSKSNGNGERSTTPSKQSAQQSIVDPQSGHLNSPPNVPIFNDVDVEDV